MSAPHGHYEPSRVPLLAMASLAVLALLLVTLVQVFDLRTQTVRDPGDPTVASVSLRFEDRAEGAIAVFDAGSGRLLETIAAGEDGFLRSTMRTLVRDRRARGMGPEEPFRVFRTRSGLLLLSDPATGAEIMLQAFGATNARAFARLLDEAGVPHQEAAAVLPESPSPAPANGPEDS